MEPSGWRSSSLLGGGESWENIGCDGPTAVTKIVFFEEKGTPAASRDVCNWWRRGPPSSIWRPSPRPLPHPHTTSEEARTRISADGGSGLLRSMAAASSFHAFPVKTPPVATASSHRHRDSRSLPAAANLGSPVLKLTCDFGSGVSVGSILPRGGGRASGLRARAVTDDDEWGRDAPDGPQGAGAAVAEAVESAADAVIGELKTKLKELLYGTDRGLRASSETRAEIVELITQLEARNPTPAPTDALSLLNGKWILA